MTAHPLQLFADLYKFNNQLLATVSDGFEETDWLHTAGAGGNTAHWILGHLAAARRYLARRLGLLETAEPWEDAFDIGVTPADPKTYPSIEDLTVKFNEAGEILAASLATVSSTTLAKKLDEPLPDGSTDLAGMARFFYMHDTYHLGQIGLLRRQRGHAAFA
ncbi:MAG TPA: DinB family protein [Planctomycetota bacterium]|jgi:uncharacterized damage-inducible protein DinB|nr:DinB family protein [Planctomycetota bacterium]